MSGGDVALVLVAMFVAGFLNAAAGGGSLVSFPALVAAGLSPLTANVSNTLALWPGYLGGAASLRSQLRRGVHLRQVCLAAGVGAVGGAVALLVVDPDLFEVVVPFLVLLAAGLLAVPPSWLARLRPAEAAVPGPTADAAAAGPGPSAGAGTAPDAGPGPVVRPAPVAGPAPDASAPAPDASAPAGGPATGPATAGVEAGVAPPPARLRPTTLVVIGLGGAYGAYFGGALGVILLAVLNASVGGDLRSLNATKNVLSLLTNTVALVAFVGFAPVNWTAVGVGAPASLAGALAGGAVSTRVNSLVLRRLIIAYAVVAGVVMLLT